MSGHSGRLSRRRLERLLSAVEAPPPPPDLAERIQAAIPDELFDQVSSFKTSPPDSRLAFDRRWAWAASFAVLLLAGLLAVRLNRPLPEPGLASSPSEAVSAEAEDLTAATGEPVAFGDEVRASQTKSEADRNQPAVEGDVALDAAAAESPAVPVSPPVEVRRQRSAAEGAGDAAELRETQVNAAAERQRGAEGAKRPASQPAPAAVESALADRAPARALERTDEAGVTEESVAASQRTSPLARARSSQPVLQVSWRGEGETPRLVGRVANPSWRVLVESASGWLVGEPGLVPSREGEFELAIDRADDGLFPLVVRAVDSTGREQARQTLERP